MPVQLKVKIDSCEHLVLPAVARLSLNEATYQSLEQWAGDEEIYLQNVEFDIEIVCQLNRHSMSATPESTVIEFTLYMLIKEWSLDNPNSALTCSFIKRAKQVSVPEDRKYNPWRNTYGVYLDHQEESARVIVSIEGALASRYMYSPHVPKPYYYPLIGPKGRTLIQDAPDDHLHHHGMWWGHEDVNGHKTYHEFRGEGRQTHRKFLALISGPVFGQITALIDWVDADGQLLLQETRSVRFYNTPQESRIIDLHTTLHAVNGEVIFGDTKEGGFPFIRVNEQINGFQTGVLTSSNGHTREANIFGTIADWVDYSGSLVDVELKDGLPNKSMMNVGIAMFVNPDNESYAKQWFVRDYGAFTSANFQFGGGKTLASGDQLTIQQRVYVHEGDVKHGRVEERYQQYREPLVVNLLDI